jgi:uncharacterized membrane protein
MSNNKMGFQVERIAFFSDAVFAIAITLMIIEVKPPHLPHDISVQDALQELSKLTPMFFGVILSFIFIGLFWARHHQVMKHVEVYTHKLIKINMAFLLTIVFLPFSTAFVFENTFAHTWVPMVFYNLNYIAAAYFNYMFFAYILEPRNGIIAAGNPARISDYRADLLFPIGVYIVVMLVSLVSVNFAPMFYGLFGLQPLLTKKRKVVAKR